LKVKQESENRVTLPTTFNTFSMNSTSFSLSRYGKEFDCGNYGDEATHPTLVNPSAYGYEFTHPKLENFAYCTCIKS